jgi:hypothetical protein
MFAVARLSWVIGGGLFGLAVFAACGGESKITAGGASDWLSACASNADCSGALECWCGVCTKVCTETSDCAKLSKNAGCAPALASAVCGATPREIGCLLPCNADDDCKTVSPENRCVAGVCTSFPGADGGQSVCKRTPNQASRRLLDVLLGADHGCTRDTDCYGGMGISCGNRCEIPYVSKAGSLSVQQEVARIEKELCEPFAAAGCAAPVYFGCPNGDPICVRGTCEDSGAMLSSGGGLDAGSTSCPEQTDHLAQRVQAHAEMADRSCTTVADCTVVRAMLSCYDGCIFRPMSLAGQAALAVELTAVEADYCPPFEAAGCVSDSPCGTPLTVGCFSNMCEFQHQP